MLGNARKTGRKATDTQRDSWPLSKIISQFRQFVRSDYGGKTHGVEGDTDEAKRERAIRSISEFIRDDFASKGKIVTDAGIRLAAEATYEFNQSQLAGIRKRLENPINGLERRLNRHTATLTEIAKTCNASDAITKALHELKNGITEEEPLF